VPGIFFICALAGLGVPLPEDVCVLFAGVQVSAGLVDLFPALVAAYFGILVRDVLGWTIGRVLGGWLLSRPMVHRLLGAERLARAAGIVETRGSVAVLIGRGLVGMRIPVFVMSGASGIPLTQFVLWDMVGLLFTTPILVGLGGIFGAPAIDLAREILARFGWVPFAIAILAGAIILWQLKTRRGTGGPRGGAEAST
jgi:membrane protein DedA with SNARE-associated domain